MHSSSHLSAWTALSLLALPLAQARVVDHLADRIGGFLGKRAPLAQQACGQDDIWTLISNRDDKTELCSRWNTSPNATVVTYFTPISTTTDFASTHTVTINPSNRVHQTISVTATSTAWVTERAAKLKRGPAPTPAAIYLNRRLVQADSVDQQINAFMANETTMSSTTATDVQAELNYAISSACSCHGALWQPLNTVTVTETEEASIRRQAAYTITTQTASVSVLTRSHTTTVATRTVTSTTTLAGSASAGSSSAPSAQSSTIVSGSNSTSLSAPLGVAFECPRDHGSEQVVVSGVDLFVYRIYCGAAFRDEAVLWTGTASSQSDCLVACSSYNKLAGSWVCKGNSFDGAGCVLYGDGDLDNLYYATTVDSAALEKILGPTFNTTLQQRRIGSAEASSVSSVLEEATTLQRAQAPPASITSSAFSTCLTTTYLNTTDNLSWVSSTCTSNSSWYAAWAYTAETIYETTKIFQYASAIGSGSGGGGSGGGSAVGSSAVPGQAASNTGGAASTATATGTGGASPIPANSTEILRSTAVPVSSGAASGASGSGWGAGSPIPASSPAAPTGGASSFFALNSTTVLGSTDVVVSSGATSGATSSGWGNGSPLPGSPSPSPTGDANLSSWAWNSTSVWGTTVVDVSSGATSGATGTGWGNGGPLPPAPSSVPSNGSIIVEASSAVFVSSGAASGGWASGTGGASPLPGFNQSTWIGGTAVSTATSGEVSGTSGTGTGGGFPLPFPTSAWSNSTIIESVTTVVQVSSFATSGLLTGGTGGLSPLPNATITTPASSQLPPSNTTVIVDTTTTVEVEEYDSFTRSRTQGPRSGSQSPSWSGNFTNPFPGGTGTGVSTEGSPLTTAPPTSTPSGYGDYPSSEDDSWSRSRRSGYRSGSQGVSSGEAPEETPSSGFPVPYPNSTTTYSAPSGTGSVSYPSWNSSTPTYQPSGTGSISYPYWNFSLPAPTAPFTTEEIVRSSWLGQLYTPSMSTTENDVGTTGWPAPSSNGTWNPSRTQGPRSGSQSPSFSFANSTIAGPITASASECPSATATVTVTVKETVYPSTCPSCPIPSGKPWDGGYGKGYKGQESDHEQPPWFRKWLLEEDDDAAPSSTAGMFTLPSASMLPHRSASSNSAPLPSPTSFATGGLPGFGPTSVEAACRSVGNQICNGEFELGLVGWGLEVPAGSSADLLTVKDSSQRTIGGQQVARVILSEKNATASLRQPLTLCPGATYAFKAWMRVLRPLAWCEASFSIAGQNLGVVLPTMEWTSGIARAKNYTHTSTDNYIALHIDIRCGGTTSPSQLGTIDFDDLSLERAFS